jgi:hypothetical protein
MAKEERSRQPRDDDDDEPKAKPRKRPRDEDDEDEEEVKPRSKKARNEDAEDDYDDVPRTKKGKKKGYSGVIPYKNGAALAAYYCGVFGLIPGLGFLLGPIAAILGIMGIAKSKKMPESKGTGHAIAGIILGVVDVILWPILWITFLREVMK